LAQKLLYFLTLLPDQEFEMDGKWKWRRNEGSLIQSHRWLLYFIP
jgi:hypothetical protein